MNEIKLGNLLKDSWRLTWKNKFLWTLGFLILLSSFLGNIFIDNNQTLYSNDRIVDVIFPVAGIVVSLILFIYIIAFVSGILAEAGIIKAINDINLYRQIKFRKILGEGGKFFWKLFFIKILFGMAFVGLIGLLSFPIIVLFYLKAFVSSIIVGFSAAAIALPIIILLYFIRLFATLLVVISEISVNVALEGGYRLFLSSIRPSLRLFFTLIFIGLMLIFIVFSVIMLLGLVGYLLYLVLPKQIFIVAAIFLISTSLAVFFLTFSIFEVFKKASWILFFKEISGALKDGIKEEVKEKVSVISDDPEVVRNCLK